MIRRRDQPCGFILARQVGVVSLATPAHGQARRLPPAAESHSVVALVSTPKPIIDSVIHVQRRAG